MPELSLPSMTEIELPAPVVTTTVLVFAASRPLAAKMPELLPVPVTLMLLVPSSPSRTEATPARLAAWTPGMPVPLAEMALVSMGVPGVRVTRPAAPARAVGVWGEWVGVGGGVWIVGGGAGAGHGHGDSAGGGGRELVDDQRAEGAVRPGQDVVVPRGNEMAGPRLRLGQHDAARHRTAD